MNIFETIFDSLNKAQITYAVVGGVAVILHGYGRYTTDLDLILLLDEENIDKMDMVMTSMGYLPRQPIRFKDLKDHSTVKRLVSEKNMKAFTFMGQGRNLMSIDVLADASLDFDKFAKNIVLQQLYATIVPVIGFDDLLEMKRQAGRPQDLADIQALNDAKLL